MSFPSSKRSNIFSQSIGIGTTGPVPGFGSGLGSSQVGAGVGFGSGSVSGPGSGSGPFSNPNANWNMNATTSYNNDQNRNLPSSLHELKQRQQQQQVQRGNASSFPSNNNTLGMNMSTGMEGAQLLGSRGIDTSSLFHKAKNLESKMTMPSSTSAPSSSSSFAAAATRTEEKTVNRGLTSTAAAITAAIPSTTHEYNLQGTNIHSTLDIIRLQTISNILSKQKADIRKQIESKIQNRILEDWNQTRQSIMRDTVVLDQNGKLVTLGGAAAGNGGGATTTLDATDGSTSSRATTTFHPSSSSTSKSLTTHSFSVSNNPKELEDFHNLANYHHSVLYKNRTNHNQNHSLHPSTNITSLLKNATHELSTSNPIYNPYHNACKLVSTLSSTISKNTGSRSGSVGLRQPISSPKPSHSASSYNIATVKERTISSLLFLSNQFRDYLLTKVKNASSSSSSSLSTGGFIGYIMKYVELEIGYDDFSSGKRDILFKCMYYSLRCGDVHTALELYSSSRVGVDDGNNSAGGGGAAGDILTKVLEYLVQCADANGNQSSGKDERCVGLLNGLNTLSTTYITEMKDLYHHVILNTKAGGTTNNTTFDIDKDSSDYEIAVLGMLSFSDVSSNEASSVANTTIEDYIYLALWNALSPSANMTESVISIGKTIQSYGSSYFEGNNTESKSCGWAYAMPLLLCQCYKSGIVHLAESGNGIGLCLAIHLVLALMNHRRIMIIDLVDEQKLENEKVLMEENNFVISTLLIAYSKALQPHSPPMALEYLVNIPDTVMSRVVMKNGVTLSQKAEKQITNLLLETKAYGVFAGQISPDGSRPASGALDLHFTPNGVSELLSIAANDCIHEGKITDAAELLSLAGHYSTLLSLLNRKLASLVVINKEDGSERQQQRNLWRDAAHRFHSIYLSQGHSQVIQILEAEQQLSLGMDFQLLLNLMVFFDRCNDEDWKTAWELIANLDLLPAGEEAINAAVESYHSLSDEIQQIFHHIILKSMECLSNLHSNFKSSFPDSSADVQNASNQRLFEIRNKAKCLVTFAGFIRMNHANEVRAKIGKMEAYLI